MNYPIDTLEKTTDYSIFHKGPFNRNDNNLKQLIRSMSVNGYIAGCPIICRESPDGTLEIIDGNHRYTAAKGLELKKGSKLPIYYTVTDKDITVRDLDITHKSWKTEDYLVAYCQKGHPDYIELKKYKESNNIATSAALSILSGSCNIVHYDRNAIFQKGLFVVRDSGRKTGENISNILTATRLYNERVARNSRYVDALLRIVLIPTFDANSYIYKMSITSGLVQPQPDVRSYMLMIENIFNRSARTPVSLVIEAIKLAKSRIPEQLTKRNKI